MLAFPTILFLTIPFALAQGPVSTNGNIQYTCPVGDQAIQAYAPLCKALLLQTALRADPKGPQKTADGLRDVNRKQLDIFFTGAPNSYRTQSDGNIQLACVYGRTNQQFGLTCRYLGGAGSTLIRQAGGSTECQFTTINNGADPKPSGGGNFKKRQTAAAVQGRQTSFVCPLQTDPAVLYLGQTSYTTDFINGAVAENAVACLYTVVAGGNFQCSYAPESGTLINFNSAAQGRCPASACASAQYQQSLRKRAIDRRQVDPAKLRRAARLGEGAAVHERRQL